MQPNHINHMEREMRGYSAVGLDNPKTPVNMGSVMRAAGCFGASMVAFGGPRPKRLRINKCVTDPQKHYRHMPVFWAESLRNVVPHDCVPVAVELIDGAVSLNEYKHPQRAFYIFGAEDATLGARITDWCRDTVYVPTSSCLNLAACVNVVLYDRQLKQSLPLTSTTRR